MGKVRCNNCMNIYKDELGYDYEKDCLMQLEDGGEYYKGCRVCKTDEYLMDIK